MAKSAFVLAYLVLGAVVTSGCGPSQAAADPALLAAGRAAHLLAEEPPGVLPVAMAREGLEGEKEIVVLGMIGGVADPWEKGRAAFMIADPSTAAVDEEETHVCTDDSCPFCAKNKTPDSEMLALVRFVDERGQVIAVDARELFGLRADDIVVVRGRARVDELGYLVVVADGLYIRR